MPTTRVSLLEVDSVQSFPPLQAARDSTEDSNSPWTPPGQDKHAARSAPPTTLALKISIFYVLAGFIWVAFSDQALEALIPDRSRFALLATAKGGLFVVVTALFLHGMMRRELKTWNREATARDKAEAALRASEENLQLASGVGRVGIFEWDRITGATRASPLLQELDGLGGNEGRFKRLIDRLPDADRETFLTALKRADDPAGNGRLDIEHRLLHPDRGIRWMRVQSQTWFTGEPGYKRAARTIGTVMDITERKVAEETLRTNEARYRSLFENMMNGFAHCRIVFDADQPRDFVYLTVNKAFGTLTGLQNVQGRRMTEVIPGIREMDPELFETYGRVVRTGVPERFEICVSALGQWFSISAYRAAPGEFVAVFDVITERKRAEAALAASEQRFRSLVENVPNIAVQGFDARRRVTFWNKASESLYGYTKAEALDRTLEELIVPAETRETFLAAMDGFIHSGEPIPVSETLMRRKDGHPVAVCSSHIKSDRMDGEKEMHRIDLDLTAQKQAEQSLADSYKNQLRMLTHAPALIWRVGTDGKCDWLNDTWLSFTGRSREEEMSDGWLQGMHPDDRGCAVASYRSALADRKAFAIEYRLRRFDGAYRWISDNGIPYESSSGIFGGFIGYCFDVTERKRADERLREQAALLDVSQDAILVADLERTVTYWNRGAETIYGISAGEACGRKLEELIYRDPPKDYSSVWRELAKDGNWVAERQHQTRAGKNVEALVRCTVVRDTNGIAKSVLIVITDVTAKKQLESQFRRAQRLESLGALASGVAHDLNNVLTPILMSVELLRPLARVKHDHDMLQLLSDSARRGSDIVRQLLIFGRGSDSPRAPMNMGGVVKEVGRMVRETFPKNLVLSFQVPADLWLIEADRTQIHQIALNLCVNARDAMPRGGRLSVTAENAPVEEAFAKSNGGARGGAHVRLRVKDTGTGIAPEHLDKIFDPFFTTKPVGEGTGLGLATVIGIVRSHSGFLCVHSQLGVGTVFDIYLPAAMSDLEKEVVVLNNVVPRGRGECVLVVDDEEPIRNMLQRLLIAHNYDVLVASDGAEGVGIFAQNAARVRLLLTDVIMPVMDGAQTVRALRRLNPALPVVAISGVSAQREEFEKNLGANIRFLPKPFPAILALQRVREALDEAADVPAQS